MTAGTAEAKAQAQALWNAYPCGGAAAPGTEYGSREFFDEVRRTRYGEADPWLPRVVDFSIGRGKRLLEIGYGIGTDLLTFAEHGADVAGIDLAEEHYRLARQNFEL